MDNILLFFALPVATIILSIVLQKILKCPILVAATFFAIYLIVTYAVFGSDFLIFAIAYSILSYIIAVIVNIIKRLIEQIGRYCRMQNCNNLNDDTSNRNTLRANVTLNANQENPVLFLSNRNVPQTRRNCCCGRK